MPKRKKIKVSPPLTGIDELPNGKVNLQMDEVAFRKYADAFDIMAYQSLKQMCDSGMFPNAEEEMEELRAELMSRGLDVDTLIEVEIDETQ